MHFQTVAIKSKNSESVKIKETFPSYHNLLKLTSNGSLQDFTRSRDSDSSFCYTVNLS